MKWINKSLIEAVTMLYAFMICSLCENNHQQDLTFLLLIQLVKFGLSGASISDQSLQQFETLTHSIHKIFYMDQEEVTI